MDKFTNKSLPFNEFRQINGLQYLRLDDYPFNGYYLQEDEMKKIRSLRHFKNGLLHDSVITWRENGLKFHQGFYKKGLKDGLYEYWSKNNIKILEQNFKNGKLDGLTVKRYQNGLKKFPSKFFKMVKLLLQLDGNQMEIGVLLPVLWTELAY